MSSRVERIPTFILLLFVIGAHAQNAAAANKAKVELLPSVTAVAPGQPFDLALKFTVEAKWHIYWKNAGESGMAPGVEWELPAGFKASDPQFPIPKRHEQSGIITNILEGEPVLLVTVTPPADMPTTEKIKIAAALKWLVCKEQCLMEQQSVSLSLDAAATADAAKPANDDLFKAARKRLPIPGAQAKYVTLTPSMSKGNLSPGGKFELELAVKIKPGFHIQSNKPLVEGLIAADVFTDKIEGVFFDPAVYPAPKLREMPGLGKLSEFVDEVKIKIPGDTDTTLPAPSYTLGGVFVYQACNEKGTCYPPEGVEWSLDVPVSKADASPPANPVAEPKQPTADSAPKVAAKTEPPPSDTMRHSADAVQSAAGPDDPIYKFLKSLGLPGLLIGSFLYGLLVNATPCVLPLLSIKVLGFVQQAHESRRRTMALGLAFGAGVMLFYVVLGFLAAAGKNVLQFPMAVIALGAVVLAMALSMLGVFTLQVPTAAAKLDDTLRKEGMLTSFGKGALAPVLGFACTGPLLAAAFGWATKQPPETAVFAFLVAGLGMASPYMILGANPKLLSFLPKPGAWMITFERIMGFLLIGMVIWLIHPLVEQIGADGLEWTLKFFVAIGFACWIWGKLNVFMPRSTQWKYRGSALALIALAAFLIYGWIYPLDVAIRHTRAVHAACNRADADWADEIPWRPWTEDEVRRTVQAGSTAFVDFTSAYCTQCKVNKAIAINTSASRAKMKELGIVPFQGDFTSGDPAIFAMLQRFDQAGVPLNLIYPAGNPDKPIVLRTALTLDYFLEKLAEIGTRSPSLASAPVR